MGILSLFSDPKMFLLSLVVSLPGVLLALSAHEAAHGYIALKCGDPTAKYMGRVTLNPLKHIDIVGFLCMIFVGFGWAKPVPVNPNNFKSYRRDDLRVSLAGITMNLLLFLLSVIIMFALFLTALSGVEELTGAAYLAQGEALYKSEGELVFKKGYQLYSFTMKDMFESFSGMYSWMIDSTAYGVEDLLIVPAFGAWSKYLYMALSRFATLNLLLAVFNLIPMPPLDGYHVLNDLVLKRPLFAPAQATRIGMGILFGLIMLGNITPKFDILSILLNAVRSGAFKAISSGVYAIYASLL